MGGSSKKESNRADDLARQERERAAAQAAALQAQQAEVDRKLQARIGAVTTDTPQEFQTREMLSRFQPETGELLRQAARGGNALNTPLGMALQERLLADLNREPADTFAPNLQLLQGEVGKFAARRGIVGSGLELEQLGRSGVELAIQQAQARENIRAADTQRAIQGNTALETIGASRRGEFSGFTQNLQVLEDARRARQVGAVSGGAQQGAQLLSTGNLSALERLSTGEARAIGVESQNLQNQVASRAAREAAIVEGLGALFGSATKAGLNVAFPGAGGVPGATPTPPPVVGAGQLRATQRQPSRFGGYDEFYQRFQ